MTPMPEAEAVDGLEVVDHADFDPAIDKEYSQQSRRADEIVRQLLNLAVGRGATDVHMEPLSRSRMHVRFRIDGILRELELGSAAARLRRQRARHRVAGQDSGKLDIAEKRRPQDGSFRLRSGEPDRRTARLRPAHFGDAELLRRKRGRSHPRPATRAEVDRQPGLLTSGSSNSSSGF